MEWQMIGLGPLQTNGFLLKTAGEAIMIDPGGDAQRVNEILETESLTLKEIWLTHAHFDHIGGVQDLRERWSCPVYLHESEREWLTNPSLNGSGFFMGIEKTAADPADVLIKEEGAFGSGNFRCELLHTPGHSPGSVSFYFPEENIIFSGDVLFRGGVGRTDLPGGDQETLLSVIEKKLLSLPEQTTVANGHGPLTSIGEEKQTNPFINGFGW